MVLLGRIELPTAEYQSAIIPFNYRSKMVLDVRFELTTYRLPDDP